MSFRVELSTFPGVLILLQTQVNPIYPQRIATIKSTEKWDGEAPSHAGSSGKSWGKNLKSTCGYHLQEVLKLHAIGIEISHVQTL